MKKPIISTLLVILFVSSIGAYGFSNYDALYERSNNDLFPSYPLTRHSVTIVSHGDKQMTLGSDDGYDIQWKKEYGTDQSGGRYEGPQPIGDCDNDGDNEVLIGGRDGKLSIFGWNAAGESYEKEASLTCPFQHTPVLWKLLAGGNSLEHQPYPSGFAIGDVTGDGTNEIVVTWYAAYETGDYFNFISVHKWFLGRYRLIGFTPWVLQNNFGVADCYIGDCDNDGDNDVLVSGEGMSDREPEIVVFTWAGCRLVKLAEHDEMHSGYAPMAGLGDVDNDGDNEIVYGAQGSPYSISNTNKVIVLDWNETALDFDATVIQETKGYDNAPFGGWCGDSDGDGIDEIHVGYTSSRMSIFEWDGTEYTMKYNVTWPDGEPVIEGINVGDVDDDGFPEVCVGSGNVHILQWNGVTYEEESILHETYGLLAVVIVGDSDNDGKNEINVAPVFVDEGQQYIYWIFKYGL